ncbi:UNVERIFIED_ORG: hypothetical protein OKW15_001634 [Pseudomonas reinekei]|nr:hypothetical protein [Pseudomonas reinekei]
MGENRFKIIFEGALLPGVDITTAKLNLADLFKSDVTAIERLFTGRPVALKTQPDAGRCPDLSPGAEQDRYRRAHRSRNTDRVEPRRRT